MPESLDFALPGLITKPMDDRFFGSIEVHIRMLFSNAYYDAFSGYEYILTYHLDALVFSEQFEMKCDKGYDFIGARWVKHPDSPNAGMDYEGKVGNSGFSLKKISAFRNILRSKDYAIDPGEFWQTSYAQAPLGHQLAEYTEAIVDVLAAHQ